MPAQQHTNQFRVKVDGAPIPEQAKAAIVHLLVEDNVALPDMFSVTFRDPSRQLIESAKVKVGSVVEVSLVSDGSPGGEKLITGEVTALEAEFDPGGMMTVVRGYDHSHRLFRGRGTETYTDVTYSDVARKVAQRAGLAIGRIDSVLTVHSHVSQGNATDWQFLGGLAREVGFEMGVFDGKFDFRKPTESSGGPPQATLADDNPLQLTLGQNLLRFRAVVSAAEQVKEVHVRGWDMKQKREIVGTAPAATTSASLALKPADLAATFGSRDFVGVDVPYDKQPEVDAAARSLAEQIAGSFAELEGVARGNPKLRAGKAVSLSLVKAPFDGKYTLTSTRHVYDAHEGYQVWFTVSGRQERSLFGLVSNGGPGGSSSLPGVVTALVTDVNDPEQLGRVKLTFPWLSDTYVTDWARVVQLSAGNGRGTVMLPEVKDEVLVAFDQGELRRPFVVGGLNNGIDQPPLGDDLIDSASGAVKRRGFISKTGAGLVFLDDAAKEGVALFTGDRGLRISLNKSATTIKVSSSGRIEIDGTGDVKITSGGALSLEAATSIEISAPRISVKGQGPVEVKGSPIQLN